MKKILLASASITILSACSHWGMSNYKTVAENGKGIPEFSVLSNFKRVSGRGIASVNEKETIVTSFSNRKLYFLTLLKQYKELKFISRIDSPSIEMCPSFHTEVLETKKDAVLSSKYFFDLSKAKYDFGKIQAKDNQYLSVFPELNFQLSDESKHPTVAESFKPGKENEFGEKVLTGYKNYLGKLYQELDTLCQKGQTENYFVFENLVSYGKTHPLMKEDEKAVKALLKSYVFSNMLVLDSFKMRIQEGRTIASMNVPMVLENEVLTRIEVQWFNDYLKAVGQTRSAK